MKKLVLGLALVTVISSPVLADTPARSPGDTSVSSNMLTRDQFIRDQERNFQAADRNGDGRLDQSEQRVLSREIQNDKLLSMNVDSNRSRPSDESELGLGTEDRSDLSNLPSRGSRDPDRALDQTAPNDQDNDPATNLNM